MERGCWSPAPGSLLGQIPRTAVRNPCGNPATKTRGKSSGRRRNARFRQDVTQRSGGQGTGGRGCAGRLVGRSAGGECGWAGQVGQGRPGRGQQAGGEGGCKWADGQMGGWVGRWVSGRQAGGGGRWVGRAGRRAARQGLFPSHPTPNPSRPSSRAHPNPKPNRASPQLTHIPLSFQPPNPY